MMSATNHRDRAKEALSWGRAETDPELRAYWLAAAETYATCAERAEARERAGLDVAWVPGVSRSH
jgi:uncharacterized protein YndB with AHSA1/START domain